MEGLRNTVTSQSVPTSVFSLGTWSMIQDAGVADAEGPGRTFLPAFQFVGCPHCPCCALGGGQCIEV